MTRADAEELVRLLAILEADPGIPPEWRHEIAAVRDIAFAVKATPPPDTYSRKTLGRKLRSVS